MKVTDERPGAVFWARNMLDLAEQLWGEVSAGALDGREVVSGSIRREPGPDGTRWLLLDIITRAKGGES